MRRLRWLLLLGTLCLNGCSLTQLAYNRADVMARWELSNYLRLDATQQATFDAGFRELWDWHRQHELPIYVLALRTLADTELPLDETRLEALSQALRQHWQRLIQASTALSCALGPTLSDAQVTSLLAGVDDKNQEYARRHADPPAERQRRATERQLRKQLDRWTGPLNREQRAWVRQWTDTRELTATPWLAYRRQWRDALAQTLEDRHGPAFCARVRTLLLDGESLQTPEQRAVFDRNHRQWISFLADLGQTLSTEQQQHLRSRLRELAQDLERLTMVQTASEDAPQ